jgi:two-component system sensor histidine kinase YesM
MNAMLNPSFLRTNHKAPAVQDPKPFTSLKHLTNLSRFSFRSQLALAFITIAVLAVLIMSIVAYTQAIKVLKHNLVTDTNSLLQRTRDELLTKLNNVENTLKLISTDQRLQKITRPDWEISNHELTKFFMDCINLNNYQANYGNQHFVKNLIDELIFLNDQRIIISRREHFSVYGIEDYLPQSLMERAQAAQGAAVWSGIFFNRPGSRLNANLPPEVLREELNQLALVKYVTNEKFKTGIGYLIASINLARLSDLIEEIVLGQTGRIYIVDQALRVIAGRDKDLIFKPLPLEPDCRKLLKRTGVGSFEGVFKGQASFVHSIDIRVNHWKMIGIIASHDFEVQARSVRNRILLGGLVILFFCGWGATFLAGRVTQPILNICNFLQKVEAGDLTLRTAETGSIEIEKLSTQLNQMIERTAELLNEVYQEQIFQRKVALKALHAQINPHFLYNTLDSISWMIESGRRDVATEIIKSLATFFRIGLSGGREIISIQDEARHAESYLKIQKIRYQDKLDYLFDIDEAIFQAPIVKITLQPLLENAIYHGIKLKADGKGIICITGSKIDAQTVRLTVVNNGPGMEEQKLAELRLMLQDANISPETSGKGYSLANINSRIKLYFGKEYGLHYSSNPETGTRVEILLPLFHDENFTQQRVPCPDR